MRRIRLIVPIAAALLLTPAAGNSQTRQTTTIIGTLYQKICRDYGADSEMGVLLPANATIHSRSIEFSDNFSGGWKPELQGIEASAKRMRLGEWQFDGYYVTNRREDYHRDVKITVEWTGDPLQMVAFSIGNALSCTRARPADILNSDDSRLFYNTIKAGLAKPVGSRFEIDVTASEKSPLDWKPELPKLTLKKESRNQGKHVRYDVTAINEDIRNLHFSHPRWIRIAEVK